MTVFFALLLDAYRQLNSRKLFWVTLALSAIVVLIYLSIGFNEDGVFFLFGVWEWENDLIYKDSQLAPAFYTSLFTDIIVKWWLGWIAIILALVSTASIFPDFIAGGSIDLVLCRPVSRTRLFIIKYITSLLFVIVQVALFCVGVMCCIWLRVGELDPAILLAIPIVTLVYSYLYGVAVLLAIITRSTITSLLLTLLLWSLIALVQFAGFTLTAIESGTIAESEVARMTIEHNQNKIEMIRGGLSDDSTAPEGETTREKGERILTEVNALNNEISNLETSAESQEKLAGQLKSWRKTIKAFSIVFPKTGQTKDLLNRWILDENDLQELQEMDNRSNDLEFDPEDENSRNRYVGARAGQIMVEEMSSYSVTWVLATSIGFELFVLFIAWLIFVRRDF